MKKEQTIIKFDNIKDLLYHSANTYADNIAFTTKIKNGKEVEYIITLILIYWKISIILVLLYIN